MAAIPSGHYLMGCTLGEGDCEIVETPAHRVSVKGFYMDRGEVTAAAYAGCVEAGKCASPLSSTDAPYCTWGDPKLGDHPINCVTWAQAKAYCAWAEKRLPTEAEWEYAARGGYNDRRYPWGNEEADCSRAVMADGCGRMGTWAEGSKAANGFGLLDMAGNVSEWVEDCLHDSYLGAPADGRAWTEGECTTRLLRDGSWFYRASGSFRVSNRSWLDPATQNPSAGFRCVKD
jgi:serine/threonine-protein kinase